MVHSKGSEGFSIVGAVVALALLGITISVASATFRNNLFARKQIVGQASTFDLESSLTAAVGDAYRGFVGQQCAAAGTGLITTIPINPGIQLLAGQSFGVAGAPSSVIEGANRCNDSSLNRVPLASSSNFFRCYSLQVDSNLAGQVEKGTVLAGSGSFVEVYGVIKNFQTGSRQPCSAMAANFGGYGIQIFYRVHWGAQRSKSGVLNIAL